MKYIHWGNREDLPFVSRLGFGTTRFLQSDLTDSSGLKRCVALVEYAIQKGINYFDVAPTYANGMAERILGEAFKGTKEPVYVAAKSGLMIDKTADDILRRIDESLALLNREKIDFYHVWSVLNWSQFEEVSQHGGILDGVRKAKDLGLIDHICISLHCDPQTTLRILDEEIFEGITISFNALNYHKWGKALEIAAERKIAVATMNSLAGGIIPRYGTLFSNLDDSQDSSAKKALRFVLQQSGVNVALSGMPTKEIIDENCEAVDGIDDTTINHRFVLPVNESLCSGCNYCAPCSVGIPISACMQAYNHRILVCASGIEQDEQSLVNDIFTRVRANGAVFPDLKSCISCHACERRCTQKINISERMHWLEKESRAFGYDNETMRERLASVEEKCKKSKIIAIWPAADYASRTLDYWGNKEFEERCVFVNASPAMWGKEFRGKKILSPDKLLSSGVETIVIMHHRLQNTIYEELTKKYSNFNIVCLHESSDVDWFNRMI